MLGRGDTLDFEIEPSAQVEMIVRLSIGWCLIWNTGEHQCHLGSPSVVEAYSQMPDRVRAIEGAYYSLYYVDEHGRLVALWANCHTSYLAPILRLCDADPKAEDVYSVQLAEGIEFIDVKASEIGAHACARTVDLDLYCWGAEDILGIGPVPALLMKERRRDQTLTWLPETATYYGRGSDPVLMPFGERIIDYAVTNHTICVIGEVSGLMCTGARGNAHRGHLYDQPVTNFGGKW